MDWHQRLPAAGDAQGDSNTPIPVTKYEDYATLSAGRDARVTLAVLPNEVLLHVLGFLDVSDLLATSRVSSCLLIPMKGGDFLLLDGVHVAMDVSTMCLPDHREFLSTCLFRRNIHVGTLSLSCLTVCNRTQTGLPLNVQLTMTSAQTSHQFRSLALDPILHRLRLRHARNVLPPLLSNPSRPTLTELIQRSIFLTNTTVVSRRLARSLTAIRLSRRLAARPEPETLVARSVLPPECVPFGSVAPGLVAKRRAVEREQVRDGMRRWVGGVWERRWREKAEDRRRWEERSGVGRVWRLRRFWERVGKGEIQAG